MRKVAFIGTGGTISSVVRDRLDVLDYGRHGSRVGADEILGAVPELAGVAAVLSIPFSAIESSDMTLADWRKVVLLCNTLVAEHRDLDGIVVGHGTATIEETAYLLNLTLKVDVPVVMVGSMRPLNGLSSDASMNLVNACRVAVHPGSVGRGVLVVLNDEIHAARDVSKTSTMRLQAFASPAFGILGQIDGEHVRYYRRTERRHVPDTEFDLQSVTDFPRIDIAYSYLGADGAAVRAFVDAGAAGIVQAAFAPGMATNAETQALSEAIRRGVVVVQSTRVGSGYALDGARQRKAGIVSADNLSPQKARILLGLALTRTKDPEEIARIFAAY